VAIISYGLWRDRFKSELNGKVIKLDGEPYMIVGVVPEDFHFNADGPRQYLGPARLHRKRTR